MAHRRLRTSATTRKDSERPRHVRGTRGQLPAAAGDSSMAPERLLALFAAKDLDALIDTSFTVLGATVPCDFVSTFYRSTGDGLLKERDSRGREPGPAFMRRYVELTPALPFAMANRGISVLSTRTILPGIAELRKTAFYREIMRPQGWRHAVSLCFWGDPLAEAPIFVTSVYRGQGHRDFSEHDIGKLARLHPFVDSAVNRVHDRDAATTVRDGMALAVQDGIRGLAILDRHLLLVQANHAARQLCAAWVDDGMAAHTEDSSTTWCLPAVLESQCRELNREWQCLVRSDPDATDLLRRRCQVVHARVPGLTVSITMISPSPAGLAEPVFVLEFDRRVHGVALEPPDASVPVLQKLTAAERAVALVLADGFSNQEIADRLRKSVHAVKYLLHRIYEKTGVPNRAALVAVLRSRRRPRQHAS